MSEHKTEYLPKILEPVLFVLLATLVVLVLVQIISRYLVQLPLRGIEELARLIFVWACFLGVALCSVRGRDIKAEFLKDVFPTSLSCWISLLTDMVIVVVSMVMVVSGSQFVISRWVYPDYSTALFYPRSLFWAPVPVSGAIIFLHTVRKVVVKTLDIFSRTE